MAWFVDIEDTFCPWAVAVRRYTVRVGATSWPFVGIGHFIVANRAPVNTCAISVGLLVLKGELRLFDMFDEAMDHRALREETWPMFRLGLGEAAWIPYGWIPLVCGDEEINSFIVAPWVNDDLYKKAKAVDDGAEFLLESTAKHARKNQEKSPWKVFANALGDFFEQNK